MTSSRVDVWFVLLLFLGVGSVANGAWMTLDASGWFGAIASDVTPFNLHFVRDVGAAYLAAGVALVWAAWRPGWRFPLVGVATVFHGLHAFGHVRETASGELASFHWLTDLPGVYLPALLLVAMVVAFRQETPSEELS